MNFGKRRLDWMASCSFWSNWALDVTSAYCYIVRQFGSSHSFSHRHHEVAKGAQRRRNRIQRIMGHLQPDLPFHAPGFNCVGPSEDAEAYNTHHHHYLTT